MAHSRTEWWEAWLRIAFTAWQDGAGAATCTCEHVWRMMCITAHMTVSATRSRLADVIGDARAHHAPVFLTRRGRRVAAVIDAEDLERLTEAAEDLADIKAAQAARAEVAEKGTVPWDEVKATLGLA